MLLGRYIYWSELFKHVLFCNTADKKILSQSTFANNLVGFQMLAGIMEKYWEKSCNQSDHWVLTKYFIVFVFYESILIRNINIFTYTYILYLNKVFLGVVLAVNQRIRYVDIREVNVWASAKMWFMLETKISVAS